MTLVERFYSVLASIGRSLQSPFLLLIRLAWGWQFIGTGWGKLHSLDRVTQFFTSLGIPAASLNAPFVALLEFAGGILLVLGLGSRLIAGLLAIDMIVAYVTADREALLSVFSDTGKFYGAAPYTFLVASLLIFIFGPGKFSLDAILDARFRKRTSPEADAGERVRRQGA